jgi:predicted 3-demethylubiquinone-9 3-methyltransferase (glyoxalase superfamily)
MTTIQMIAPCLWFDTQAEDAANFYISIFANSRILRVLHYTQAGFEIHGKPSGSILTVEFELNGQKFTALNGGPQFKFNEAISLEITCETQNEVDYYWNRLGEDGEFGECGWLKDKFGLSWQIAPAVLGEMLNDPDNTKVERVMSAFLPMKKIDIATLKEEYAG